MSHATSKVTLADVVRPTLSELDKISALNEQFEEAGISAIAQARAAVDKAEADAERNAIHLLSKRSSPEARRIEREQGASVRALARACSEAAMLSLATISADITQPASARYQAAQAILERAHGKAGQTFSTMEVDLVGLSATDAIDRLMVEFQEGRISAEELAVMSKVIEIRAKTTEISAVVDRVNELEQLVLLSQTKQ